eukprot:jgi/Hompol1/4031/HPOL_003443-RA
MKGQSFNSAGILGAATSLLRPSTLVPHVAVADIRQIDWPALKRAGFRAVAFDKDNTLTAPYAAYIHPPLEVSLLLAIWICDSWRTCIKTFGNDAVVIVSNSAGCSNDKDYAEKPAGGETLVKHLMCKPCEIIVVGDRLFTDILYANRIGALSVLVRQIITEQNDNWFAKQ